MSRLSHDTRLAQKHAVRPEDFYDFQVGEAVVADGFAGRVVAVLDGPYPGTEGYQVVLDNNMGGGLYEARLLYRAPAREASTQNDSPAAPDLDPFEGAERTTANLWYPELGSILSDRPPIENLKVYASRTAAAEGEEPVEETEEVGQQDQPDTCSFCGSAEFDEFADTGRGTRARCAQCDGTMLKPYDGIQWSPEFPNSPANRPSRAPDSRSIINDPQAVHSSLHQAVTPEEHAAYWGAEEESPECTHPWCKDEPYHTEAEHLDPPDRDPHSDLYHEMTPKVDEAMHHLRGAGDLLDTYHTGPTKYSVLNAAATVQARYPIFTGLDPVTAPEPHFEFTATWREVRAKATRLRKEGRVRLLGASREGAVGEVDGDTAIYETEFHYVPGGRKIAYWHCGCKWGAYAWGRSSGYERFEGRPCSHNLALRYTAQSKGMFGRDVTPDTDRLDGQRPHSPVQVQYQRPTEWDTGRDITRRTVPPGNMRSEWTPESRVRVKGSVSDPEISPAHEWARIACASGVSPTDVLAALRSLGMAHQAARAALDYATASWAACAVLADGELGYLLDVDPHTRIAILTDGREVPVELIRLATHPLGEEGIADAMPDDEPTDGSEPADGLGGMQATGTYDGSSFGGGATADPYRSTTPHAQSANPASTGWATSADPPNWELQVNAPSNLTTYNSALHTAADDDPPSVSGVALKAGDTGRVLMIQRGLQDEKDPARGTWEFPGGHHEEDDQTSLHAGVREWEEEVGQPFPSGGHLTGVSRNGPYLLHHVVIPSESDVKFSDGRGTVNPDDPDGDGHEQSAWWEIEHAKKNPALREEVKKTPWGDLAKAATLHDEPEPALPSTDGATEEPDPVEGDDDGASPVAPEPLESSRQAEWGFPESTVNPQAGDEGVDPEYLNSADYGSSPGAGSAGLTGSPSTPVVASMNPPVDPILAEFWKTAGGAALRADASGGGPAEKGSRGGAGEFSDSDIASAAKAVLAKMAAKDFDYAEQRELIEEGLTSNARARNFDELDLEGTHYALLDGAVADDETLWL